MSELRPCPFCGGEAELTGYKAPEYWVWCPNCKASAGMHTSKDSAIAAWNTRTERMCYMVRETVDLDGERMTDYSCGCFNQSGWGHNYCPNCGAKVMRDER